MKIRYHLVTKGVLNHTIYATVEGMTKPYPMRVRFLSKKKATALVEELNLLTRRVKNQENLVLQTEINELKKTNRELNEKLHEANNRIQKMMPKQRFWEIGRSAKPTKAETSVSPKDQKEVPRS